VTGLALDGGEVPSRPVAELDPVSKPMAIEQLEAW
jgi:hypothetical protein